MEAYLETDCVSDLVIAARAGDVAAYGKLVRATTVRIVATEIFSPYLSVGSSTAVLTRAVSARLMRYGDYYGDYFSSLKPICQ
jgi:hypothetical protein